MKNHHLNWVISLERFPSIKKTNPSFKTPLKINMEPQNHPFAEEDHLNQIGPFGPKFGPNRLPQTSPDVIRSYLFQTTVKFIGGK